MTLGLVTTLMGDCSQAGKPGR